MTMTWIETAINFAAVAIPAAIGRLHLARKSAKQAGAVNALPH
jgi:hypothetical protein